MMLVLDTDHLSVLGDPTPQAQQFAERLAGSGFEVVTTVISVEENLRGWLAQIHRAKDAERRIIAYARFQRRVEFFADWVILSWDSDAGIFADLRKRSVRVGTQDLRITAITLAHDATLLTRNTGDFSRVPELRIENWLV